MNDPRILEEGALYVGQNYFWESAAYYWSVYKPNDGFKLNEMCDEGTSVKEITETVKGSSDLYTVRQQAYDYYIEELR